MSPEEMIAAGWRDRVVRQEASLDEVRRRAVQLLSASLLVAGLFAVAANNGACWQIPFKVLALLSLVGLIALITFVEWPRKFEFDQDTALIAGLVAQYPGHYSQAEAATSIAAGTAVSWAKNQPKLDLLHKVFSGALVAAGVQAIFWIIAAI